jgi:hypothetical protein
MESAVIVVPAPSVIVAAGKSRLQRIRESVAIGAEDPGGGGLEPSAQMTAELLLL